VARYADACNLFATGCDDVAHKLDVLRGHCEAEGRDYATIEKTILALGNPNDDPDAFVAEMAGYARLGVDAVEVMPAGDPVEFTTALGRRVIPRLGDLGGA